MNKNFLRAKEQSSFPIPRNRLQKRGLRGKPCGSSPMMHKMHADRKHTGMPSGAVIRTFSAILFLSAIFSVLNFLLKTMQFFFSVTILL